MTNSNAVQEIKKYIKANRGCVLATNVDGVPRATPVNYFSEGTDIYIYSEGGRKFSYLLKNKKVSLGIYHTKPLFGAQVFGTAEIFKQDHPGFMLEVKKSGFMKNRVFAGERPPYFLSLVKITPEKIVYWSTRQGQNRKTIWDLQSTKGPGSVIHDQLEFINGLGVKHVYPALRKKTVPLVFVPDAFQGSWAYSDFQHYFALLGWESYALNFRGHFVGRYARQDDGSSVGGVSGDEHFENYVEDLAKTIAICKRAPYIVATGLGALVALKYAERDTMKKIVLINSAPTSELFDKMQLNKKKVKEYLGRHIKFTKNGTCTPQKQSTKKWLFQQIKPAMHTEFEAAAFLNAEPSNLFLQAMTGGISVKLGPKKPSIFIIGARKDFWAGENVSAGLAKQLAAKKLLLTDKSCQTISLMPDWQRYAGMVAACLK